MIAITSNIDEVEKYVTEESKINPNWSNTSDAQFYAKELKNEMQKSKEIREYFEHEAYKIKTLFYPYINLSNIAIDSNKN